MKTYLPCMGVFNLCVQIFPSGIVSFLKKSIQYLVLSGHVAGNSLVICSGRGYFTLELFSFRLHLKVHRFGFCGYYFCSEFWRCDSHASWYRFLQFGYRFALFSATYIFIIPMFRVYIYLFFTFLFILENFISDYIYPISSVIWLYYS